MGGKSRWRLALAGAICAGLGAVTTGAATGRAAGRHVSVVAGGEIIAESRFINSGLRWRQPGERFNYGPVFARVAAIIREADLGICHAETGFGPPNGYYGLSGRAPNGGGRLTGPFEFAVGLAGAGFDRCSTASNHAYDRLTTGIRTTLDALDRVGMSHNGTARSPEEADPAGSIVKVQGVKIAHLSFTTFSNMPRPIERWKINFTGTASNVAAKVKAAREAGAELVIVSLHTRPELVFRPTQSQRDFVKRLLSLAKIDLVISHGPHVIQPMQIIDGTPVFWSVGNMNSGMGVSGHFVDPNTRDGLLARVVFDEDESGHFRAMAEPILICAEPLNRILHAPVRELASGAAMSDTVRSQMTQCVKRARKIEPRVT